MRRQKNKILFVIDSLSIGGAEKSLVTLLSMLDYEKYDVDLQLFAIWGKLLQFVPPQVNILPEIPYIAFLRKPLKEQLKCLNPFKLLPAYAYSRLIRRNCYNLIETSCIYWKCLNPQIEKAGKRYDIAVGYGQGAPTMYVSDKVTAERKFAWINACYAPEGKYRDYLRHIYSAFHGIVPVSDGANKIFSDIYPEFSDRMTVIWDIINPSIIRKMSLLPAGIDFDQTKPVIVTLSRLDCNDKGMDITLQTAKALKERGTHATWHIFGDGPYRRTMEEFITDHGLSDFLFLHGAVSNPYPFLNAATVYVQTSRAEGFGISIAEARLLDKPVVTTPYRGVENQIIPGKNGIVASFSPEDIADKITSLLSDRNLFNEITSYLKSEKKGNPEEINKVHRLFDQL
ncbi:MAG: glycosyltransferase [Duncaniella sp.]|nr:glycosyltransferase [Duncaniella sp.]